MTIGQVTAVAIVDAVAKQRKKEHDAFRDRYCQTARESRQYYAQGRTHGQWLAKLAVEAKEAELALDWVHSK